MNKHDNIITSIENVLLDSELNTYEAIGVLEVVKQLLFKAIEIGDTIKIDTENKLIFDILEDMEKDEWWLEDD